MSVPVLEAPGQILLTGKIHDNVRKVTNDVFWEAHKAESHPIYHPKYIQTGNGLDGILC